MKSKFIISGLISTFLFVLMTGRAFPGSVSLNALVDEALKNNPQIQAAEQRFQAAKARVTLTRSLADPKLEYGYDKITADMAAVTEGKTAPMRTFSASQDIPFPTKLFLRREAAQKEADALEQDYRETRRQVVKEVKDAYVRLFLNTKKIVVANENLELLNQMLAVATKKFTVNQTGQQDVLKAQVEYSKRSNERLLLEQEKTIAQALLNALLNREQDSPVVPQARLPARQGLPSVEIDAPVSQPGRSFDEADIIRLTKANRPELKSRREMLAKSGVDVNLAKQEYLPDLSVKYTREQRDGGMGEWAGMVGVTFPLWFGGKQEAMVKEARANLDAAKAEYRSTENTVVFEARSAFAKYEAARKLVNIYETGVLPQAKAALETARLGYQADKISFLDLLEAQRSLRDFQIEYFESLANLETAKADLERSVGIDLSEEERGSHEK
jgi:outer membrane protein, heavy metal efflux system